MKDAFSQLGIPPHKLLMVSGIGQAGKTPHFMQCNLLHALHGRALPAATGAKLANHDLTVVVNSGDGDCYGEGGNHFLNAIRKNVDLTLLVHNNQVYGLTKGQASPTAGVGFVTKIQRHGVTMPPLNPLALALTLGAGFVAQGFSGDKDHLSRLIQEGMRFKGFSFIDILQPCVSFNPVNTFGWYKERVYDLFEQGYEADDMNKARELCEQKEERIPIGILYRKERPSHTDTIKGLEKGPLVNRAYDPDRLQAILDG